MPKRRDDEQPEDRLLQEMIEAARHDAGSDQEWEGAQGRLRERLHRSAATLRQARRGTDVRPSRKSAPPVKTSRRGGGAVRAVWTQLRSRPLAASFSAVALFTALLGALLVSITAPSPVYASSVTGGDLRIIGPDGETSASCPLRHTKVEANVTGFISRTVLRQTFENPLPEKIEAIYVFPLPGDAAVDSMVIEVEGRRIVGSVKPREEARQVYDAARAAGKVAGLLDQERPNIFTQSVANIAPGTRVEVEISYVETLKLENGFFEYTFPMVVAPRYIPGAPTNESSDPWHGRPARDPQTQADNSSGNSAVGTDKEAVQHGRDARATGGVPDASRITPPVAPPDMRAGHDIEMEIFLQAGSEIYEIESALHEVEVDRDGTDEALVSLKNRREIPNKDFILRYRTATDAIGDAFLTANSPLGQYFMLWMQPPRRVESAQARPKEMIFVIDRSGSMSGAPIEKAKQTMSLCIESMNPNDTFNLLSFSGGTGRCFESPQPNTPESRATALQYLSDLHGSGGTEMMPAIMESLGAPADPNRVRIVCFMTDGQIGNDYEILDAVKKNAGTSRVFAFGIGQSPNRFLLDGMAREGRGEVQYVTLNEDGAAAAEKFKRRIDSPVLTDIAIDWGTLNVAEVYPKAIPDLFDQKPIFVVGRLTGLPQGTITLRGNTAQGAFERTIAVKESAGPERRDGLDVMWARAKVAHLMAQDLKGMQSGQFTPELRDEVTTLGVTYGLMTPFTSFVAVDEVVSTEPGDPKQVPVPVELPEGQEAWDADGDESWFAMKKAPESKAKVLHFYAETDLSKDKFAYDPSNGTVSAGDVYRVKQGNESPDAGGKHFARVARANLTKPARRPGLVGGMHVDTPSYAFGQPSTPAGPVNYRYAQPALVPSQTATPGWTPAPSQSSATPPVVTGLPDIQIGDAEQNTPVDNNLFIYTGAFVFDDHVSDAESTVSQMLWSFDELDLEAGEAGTDRWYTVNESDAPATGSMKLAPSVAEDATTVPNTSATTTPLNPGLPDIIICGPEDPSEHGSNVFVFTESFNFDDHSSTSTTDVAASRLKKLAPELRGIEKLLDAEGNLTTGPVKVTRYRLRISVRFAPNAFVLDSELAKNGLENVNKEEGVLTADTDVRKLPALAALPWVGHITPAESPRKE